MKTEHLNYIIKHIPRETPYYRRPGLALAPVYLTVHSTGNPTSTARNERGWLINPANQRTASWHICVDENEAVEAIPLNEVAWHAGDGRGGPGNRKSIAIEICESGDRAKTLKNAAGLIARLLQERGWGVEQLRRHWDWNKKLCPRILMANNWEPWENFKREIQKLLDSNPKPVAQTDPSSIAWNLPQIQRHVAGTLNGLPVEFEAYLINNSTYVPLRPLAKALGLQLEWKEKQFHIVTVAAPPN
jgi:N-acetylmuramoyl-L-alanine amidase